MIKKLKYIIAVLFTVFLVACSEDFLELDPLGRPTTEAHYVDFNGLEQSVTAAYSVLCTRDIFDIMYSVGFQSASDDMETGGENSNDWIQFQRMDRLTHAANEADIWTIWGYLYKGIRITNTVIERADEIKEKEPDKTDLIDLRVAEMKFLRAYYHFTLVQLYGGVPIVNYLVTPDDYNVSKNSIAEVLHFVQTDLLEVYPVLLAKSELNKEDNNQVGRASKGAAQALLAKAYLYEASYAENFSTDERFAGCTNQYAAALQHAEAVINSNEYYLVGDQGERFESWRAPEGGTIGGYRWIFTVDGDNSGEGVWEIQNVSDHAGWTFSRGNYMTVYTTVRFCYEDDEITGGKNAGGWSFNLPSQYMIAAFGNNDSREVGLNSAPLAPELDPRFTTTVGREGDSVLIAEGADGTWALMDFRNLPTGTISRKYECSPAEYWTDMVDFHDGPMNLRMIRYADVVLMAAEAAFKTNNTALALTYVNQVRTRARLSGDTGYPENLTALSMADIKHERRLELAMEQSRFFDVVRWGDGPDFLGGINLASMGPDFQVNFIEEKHEFFPIPATEVQRVGGLEQYDKWK